MRGNTINIYEGRDWRFHLLLLKRRRLRRQVQVRITTRGRYGLLAILELASGSLENPISLSSIAEHQGIPAGYLEQILSALRRSGIVSSVKGSQGGYYLSQKPSVITVGDVLRSLEGDLSVVEDADSPTSPGSEAAIQCLKAEVWNKIDAAIAEVIDGITVEKLITEYRRLAGSQPIMYYI